MNVLSSTLMTDPYGKTSGCIQFTIDDVTSPFVLSDIMSTDQQYTFSFWTKSETDADQNNTNPITVTDDGSGNVTITGDISVYDDDAGNVKLTGPFIAIDDGSGNVIFDTGTNIRVCGQIFKPITDWRKYSVTFTADSANLVIEFIAAGTYYIYHPKLEIGNKATDWSPAPEDMATTDDIDSVNSEIQSVVKSISALDVKADNISARVAEINTSTNTALESANGDIEYLRQEVEAKMTAEAVEIQIRTAMQDGVKKVEAKTGFTFDDAGLTIEESGSEMKTRINEDGMTVYQNDDAMLIANNVGVDAKNLRATTYLIVGGRSRFENYGSNRTGCFWIGG